MNSKNLVSTIGMMMITSLVPFMDKYPELEELLKKYKKPATDWDFFMTVAGVGAFILANIGNVNEEVMTNISEQLQEKDKNMNNALNNFLDFIERDKGETEDKSGLIGIWVLWNLKGSFPTQEECGRVAPAIGAYLINLASGFEV